MTKHICHWRPVPVALSFVLLSTAAPAQASRGGWDGASTIGRDVLVAAALITPAVQGDWSGELQAVGSLVVAGGTTKLLKEGFPERRPDGSDRKSFPSGHTSIAFAAAATLENRYGWKAGLPALAVATFVGVGRIEAKRHHWYDTVAGASIGLASGFLLTRQRHPAVRLVPWGDSKGGGLAFSTRF